jgi:hypothetical protein
MCLSRIGGGGCNLVHRYWVIPWKTVPRMVTAWSNASLARDPSHSVVAVAHEDHFVVCTRISLDASVRRRGTRNGTDLTRFFRVSTRCIRHSTDHRPHLMVYHMIDPPQHPSHSLILWHAIHSSLANPSQHESHSTSSQHGSYSMIPW